MFEKPQYMTPGGYKRSPKSPALKKRIKAELARKKKMIASRTLAPKNIFASPQKGISKEAARLIAQALKGMLNS